MIFKGEIYMNEKNKNIVLSLCFVIIIIVIFISNIFIKDTEISISERRKLAQFPIVSLKNILSGKFADEFNNYSMDQFVFREEFRKIKANFEMKVLNKKDFNGIYEYNSFLVKQEYPLKEKSIINLTKKINAVKNKYLDKDNKIYYSIIPDKNYYANTKETLKLNYEELIKIMNQNIEDMQYINIFDCLKLEDYYYTDIHWKQESISSVAERIVTSMNFSDRITNQFEEMSLLKFKGVYAGQYPLESKYDEIKVLTNKEILNAKVYNFDTKKESKVYNLDKIKSNDKYDIYLSGPSSILEIENANCDSNKELIVFRDSFASSLIPYFIEGYQKITLVDLRYINFNLLSQYIDFKNKDVLFIYSTSIINNSETIK